MHSISCFPINCSELFQSWVAVYRKKIFLLLITFKRLRPLQVREGLRRLRARRLSDLKLVATAPARSLAGLCLRGRGQSWAGRSRLCARGGAGGALAAAGNGAARGALARLRGPRRSRGVPPCGPHLSSCPRIAPAPGWARAPRAGPGPGPGYCYCCRCCSGCWPRARRGRGAAAARRKTATAAPSTPSRRASAVCSARTMCALLRRWALGQRPRSPCPGRRAPGAGAGLGRARPPVRGVGVSGTGVLGTGVLSLHP